MKYEELKAKQCFTVGELMERLKEFPKETFISSAGADGGGYDVSFKDYVAVIPNKDGSIMLRHLEADAWDEYSVDNITWEQNSEF